MSSEEIKDELDVSKLHKITTLDSVEEFNKSHSGLNLEKSPAFILFDTKEPIYTTYSYEELKKYVPLGARFSLNFELVPCTTSLIRYEIKKIVIKLP
ncbi:hypothetical protein QTL97_16760 [Sporosarcina thermotolerans]|uniref:Uncharacterized protein n=1 Tax=Sporosarcina thermotolerans TaxID=633404 RepID=A0AAW9AED6_9BACL|nr:hypothetical protein [Sporosarcina thermotolerans]MDW0118579.1 hypothetical protein [Sporosarcina thermotolerans]